MSEGDGADGGAPPPALTRVERTGPVTAVTLHRPGRGNALNGSLVESLIEAVASAARDGTELLVFRGEGRSFCTGFDLSDVDRESDGDLALRFLRIEELLQAVYRAPFPTMALAHGQVFGAGADLFCACSIRVAAPDAFFTMPGTRFGVVLGVRRLVSRVTAPVAERLVVGAPQFGAAEAVETGFATASVAPDQWPAVVESTVERAELLAPATAVRLARALAPDSDDADLADLARSVARPGLAERMRSYRDAVMAARSERDRPAR